MGDRVKRQTMERKMGLLETIKRKHQDNLKVCESVYTSGPYFEECKKAAARAMHEDMVNCLKK